MASMNECEISNATSKKLKDAMDDVLANSRMRSSGQKLKKLNPLGSACCLLLPSREQLSSMPPSEPDAFKLRKTSLLLGSD